LKLQRGTRVLLFFAALSINGLVKG